MAAELNEGTQRTKNIRNKYSQDKLFKLLDDLCKQENFQKRDQKVESLYDCAYSPIDIKNRSNLGHGYADFTSVQGTWRFYRAHHNTMWESFNSKNICETSYARFQGLEALIQRFTDSVYQCNTQEYLPQKFSTPRNGIQCTEPEPVSYNQRIAPGNGIQCINPDPVFGRFSRNITSKHVTPKVDREMCITPKPAVGYLQETSIEDVQRSKDEQFDNIQDQPTTAKEEIKQVTLEKNKISDDYHKAAKELICTKQMLEQKFNQQWDNIQGQLKRAEEEIKQVTLEKNKVSDDYHKIAKELICTEQMLEQKFNQQLENIQGELKTAKEEIKQVTKEKNKISDDYHKAAKELICTKQMLEQKFNQQLDNIQGQLKTAKKEIKQVTKEKKRVSDDYHKTAKELTCTQEMLEQAFNQLSDLQTKFEKLEAKLKNEKAKKCKELDELNRFMNSTKEDSSFCSICMEPWTESGEHSICSLSCGHFFGRSCITKWINQATRALSSCPICLQSASLGDLRQHYVHRICIGDE